jgi:hypothetical protein
LDKTNETCLPGRVPHISLVFREMWDTTNLDRSPWRKTQTPKLQG